MSKLALRRAENAISRICAPRYCTEVEFRRISQGSSDQYLLQIRNVGPKALRAFRERYGALDTAPSPERVEDV